MASFRHIVGDFSIAMNRGDMIEARRYAIYALDPLEVTKGPSLSRLESETIGMYPETCLMMAIAAGRMDVINRLDDIWEATEHLSDDMNSLVKARSMDIVIIINDRDVIMKMIEKGLPSHLAIGCLMEERKKEAEKFPEIFRGLRLREALYALERSLEDGDLPVSRSLCSLIKGEMIYKGGDVEDIVPPRQ